MQLAKRNFFSAPQVQYILYIIKNSHSTVFNSATSKMEAAGSSKYLPHHMASHLREGSCAKMLHLHNTFKKRPTFP